ncbi:hypothetical protein BGX26_001364, partial [Mortierella sp. AD094]
MERIPDLIQRRIIRFLPLSSLPSLLRLNKDWLYVTAPFLYRDPFLSLTNVTLCDGVDEDVTLERAVKLLTLLLRCCRKEYLLGADAMKHSEFSPFIDYLALYQDQTARYNYIAEEIHTFKTNNTPYNYLLYEGIRFSIASHKPEVVTQLYISMSSLENLVDYAPRFSNLRRLEIYSPTRDTESKPLSNFIQKHRLETGNRLQELSLISPEHRIHLKTEPLSLYGWTNLQKLDLTQWRMPFDWNKLPRRSLTELGFDARGMPDPFDFESFFRPCTNLQTLRVIGAKESAFAWTLKRTSIPMLPQLSALEIGGARHALRTCLDGAFRLLSESLLSLTVTLQEGIGGPFTRRSLTWTTPLPRLKRLAIRDKAFFEFDLTVLKICPSLRALNLHMDAETSGPGCTDLGNPLFVKWILLSDTFKELATFGGNLEELTLDGTWITIESILLQGILPLKQLKRLRFAWGVQCIGVNGLYEIVGKLEKLKLLEICKDSVIRSRQSPKSKFLEKEGLE